MLMSNLLEVIVRRCPNNVTTTDNSKIVPSSALDRTLVPNASAPLLNFAANNDRCRDYEGPALHHLQHGVWPVDMAFAGDAAFQYIRADPYRFIRREDREIMAAGQPSGMPVPLNSMGRMLQGTILHPRRVLLLPHYCFMISYTRTISRRV